MGIRSLFSSDAKAKEAEAEQERAEASSSTQQAPPPYSATDEAAGPSHAHVPAPYNDNGDGGDDDDDDEVPGYEHPIFQGLSENSTSITAATRKFPPVFALYMPFAFTTTYYLGTSKEDRTYAVATTWTLNPFSKKPAFLLHDGPTKEAPVFATASSMKINKTSSTDITLPPRPGYGNPGDQPKVIRAGYIYHDWRHWGYSFTVLCGRPGAGPKDPPQEETFEWRTSSGQETRAPNGGSKWSSGWKLVWTSGPQTETSGGKSKERDAGFSREGREVVAVCAHNTKLRSLTKAVRFAFMGTGLTGTLGEEFEIVGVTTALQLYFMWLASQASSGG